MWASRLGRLPRRPVAGQRGWWGRWAASVAAGDTNNNATSSDILYGTTEAPMAPPIELRCGKLSVEVVSNVGVGSVKYAGAEICRGINFLFRDESWGTPPMAHVSTLVCKAVEDGGLETVRWSSTVGNYLACDVSVEVGMSAEAGLPELTVTASAVALKSVHTSRLGFIVLHPLSGLVGEPVTVIKPEGQPDDTAAVFPVLVSPDQVFTDIAGLVHAVSPGSSARVQFSFSSSEGTLFEMEDQRQWLDGSYKTYFRPLRLTPLPYPVEVGESVKQQVTLNILDCDDASGEREQSDDEVVISVGGVALDPVSAEPVKLPSIGIGVPTEHSIDTARCTHVACPIGLEGPLLSPRTNAWHCCLPTERWAADCLMARRLSGDHWT